MTVEINLTGEASAIITPFWPKTNQNEDAYSGLAQSWLQKSADKASKVPEFQRSAEQALQFASGSGADAFGEKMRSSAAQFGAMAEAAENKAGGAAMQAQNIFNTKNMLNALGLDFQAKLEAATAAQMGSAATGSAAGVAGFEAMKTQLRTQLTAAAQMVGGGFAAANAQINQNIASGTAMDGAPSMMPPTLSSMGNMSGWGAAPNNPAQFADSSFYGNYAAGGSPMMSGMENMGGQLDYGAGAFGAGGQAGTYMGTGATFDGTPGSLINTLINNAPAVAQLAQTGLAVGEQAFGHLQQAAATVTAGAAGALGAYDDGGAFAGEQSGSSGGAGALADSGPSDSSGDSGSSRSGLPASGGSGGAGGSGGSSSSGSADTVDPKFDDDDSSGSDEKEDEEREAEVAEELAGSSNDSEAGDPSSDDSGSDTGENSEQRRDDSPAAQEDAASEAAPAAETEPEPEPEQEPAPAAQPNSGGAPPTSNAHTASMDYDINLSGESGVSADVNTSLTSAGGAGTDASQVGTHTTSAAGAPAAPAAGAAPMAAAPAAAAGAAGAGFMAAGGTGSGGGDAWGRHRRETPAALSIEPDPTVSPKSDKALDGFGRNTRRAIKQLATLDEALGTRSTGAPLALAVINSGRSVYATSDAFGFPDADTAAEVGALPAGAVPLAALLDEIPEEFLTSWVGATDPAGVMALAADKGYISPKVIFDVGRDENLPLPAGVEVVDRATLSSITPAAAASEGRRLLEDLETLDQDGLTDLSEMLTQLAKLWGMPMDADLETDEAHAAMVKRRWSSGGRPDQVQVATVWWLLLAAADALVDGTPSYASAALRMVLGFPLPSMSADAADVAGAAV